MVRTKSISVIFFEVKMFVLDWNQSKKVVTNVDKKRESGRKYWSLHIE